MSHDLRFAQRVPPPRLHRLSVALAPILLVVLGARAALAGDFDPAGRRRAHPAPSPDPAGRSATTPSGAARPGQSGAARSGGADRSVLLARYTRLALAQPTSAPLLDRLAELGREQGRGLGGLAADLEERAEGPDGFAARLVLAGLYARDAQPDKARAALEAALRERPNDASAHLAVARLAEGDADLARAREHYEAALGGAGLSDPEGTLRSLVKVLLDQRDYEAARARHRELVRLSHGSVFVRAELGRELFTRGEYALAETEQRARVSAAVGDNRTLAPALLDLARTLAKEDKGAEALETLARARASARGESGLTREILALSADVYRGQGRLADLALALESEHTSDGAKLELLGQLYDELGEAPRALATYRRLLVADPRNVEARLKVVRILQAEGRIDETIHEYEALVRASPSRVDHAIELAQALEARGDHGRALQLLADVERRSRGDAEVLERIATFYDEHGERARAVALLERLVSSAPGDPTHLTELGDRYYQQGDKRRALEVWARIKTVVPNRARALATLGDVYLDHDMPNEGLDALREAHTLEPEDLAIWKAYASALERTATGGSSPAAATSRYEQARGLWEKLLGHAGPDKNLARDARAHIVTLCALLHQLDVSVPSLERRFRAKPPDLEAGRLLAEVQIRLRRYPDAEATLARLTAEAPADADVWLALERARVQSQNLPGAIEVLEKLVQLDPRRAREYYARLAEFSAQLYRDDDALRYAARAVRLQPDDAGAHTKLAEMYAKRQETDKAIAEYRAAIAKNDGLFAVYFELARLLLSRGQIDEADELLRRVVRAAPDEEQIAQAARQSIEVNLGRDGTGALERELIARSIANPEKAVYRRLLIELYSATAAPWLNEAGSDDPARALAARRALAVIGGRAVKPLVDALNDDKLGQRDLAVRLLAYVDNKSAGPALFAFATGTADLGLRARAMTACGALRDPKLLPRFDALLAPRNLSSMPGDPVAVAAAWGVARMRDKRAAPLLSRMLGSGSPEIRALGAVGLALLGERASVPVLERMVRAADGGSLCRAAAAFGLGELGAVGSADALTMLAESSEALPRQAALLALARLGAPAARVPIAGALLSEDADVRAAAARAATALARGAYRGPIDPLAVHAEAVDVRALLAALAPGPYTADERAGALVELGRQLARIAGTAVEVSPERSRVLFDAMLGDGEGLEFAPLYASADELSTERATEVRAALEAIAKAIVPGAVVLARHGPPALASRAVLFLSRRHEPEADGALAALLGGGDEALLRTALGAMRPGASDKVVRAAAGLARTGGSWPLRMHAIEGLGRVGSRGGREALDTLTAAAEGDPYPLVREAALRSLLLVDPASARTVLSRSAEGDPESRVRAVAKDLLFRGGTHATDIP